MSKKKNAVSFAKPPEPAFLRRIKEQIGYKESPSVDTKREALLECEDDDFRDKDDEQPTVVVLKPGDLTKEEAEKLGAFVDDDSEPKKVLYKKPTKRPAEEVEGKSKLKGEVTAKKVKNKSLLSFDDEEEDDDNG